MDSGVSNMRLFSKVSSFSSPCSCSTLSELGEREGKPSSSSRCRPSGSFSPVANFLCGSLNVKSSCSWLQITERSGKPTFLLRSQISGKSNLRIADDSFSYSSCQARPSSPVSKCLRTSQLYKVSPGICRLVDIAATERLRQLGISRVGSALRNLEKEDDTEEDRSEIQMRKSHQKYDETEESAVHEEDGNDGFSALTPSIVSVLKEEKEGGWREAVIEGLGPPNGAVQLGVRIFEEDEEQDEEEAKHGVSPEVGLNYPRELSVVTQRF